MRLEEDFDLALEILKDEFALLENSDPEMFSFLHKFVNDYICGFRVNGHFEPKQ